jgi:exonuclease VII large subunit
MLGQLVSPLLFSTPVQASRGEHRSHQDQEYIVSSEEVLPETREHSTDSTYSYEKGLNTHIHNRVKSPEVTIETLDDDIKVESDDNEIDEKQNEYEKPLSRNLSNQVANNVKKVKSDKHISDEDTKVNPIKNHSHKLNFDKFVNSKFDFKKLDRIASDNCGLSARSHSDDQTRSKNRHEYFKTKFTRNNWVKHSHIKDDPIEEDSNSVSDDDQVVNNDTKTPVPVPIATVARGLVASAVSPNTSTSIGTVGESAATDSKVALNTEGATQAATDDNPSTATNDTSNNSNVWPTIGVLIVAGGALYYISGLRGKEG